MAKPSSEMAVRLTVLFSGIAVATYMLLVVIHVAPRSAATNEFRPVADQILGPYFRQDWRLFAPTPPRDDAFVYVQVRCDDDPPDLNPPLLNATIAFTRGTARLPVLAPRTLRTIDFFSSELSEINSAYWDVIDLGKFDATFTLADARLAGRLRRDRLAPAFVRATSAFAHTRCPTAARDLRARVVQETNRPFVIAANPTAVPDWKSDRLLVYDSGWVAADPLRLR